MYWDLMRIILKDINRRKFSSFLTLLSISLGILAIFVIVLLSQGFENSIQEQFDAMGTNRLYITSVVSGLGGETSKDGLTDSDLKFIENRPFIDKGYPYVMQYPQVKFGNEFKTLGVIGTTIDESFFNDLNLDLDRGRFTKDNEKFNVIIGSQVAEDLFDKEVPVGGNLYIKDTKFKVVGILEPLGSPPDDSMIYMNIDALRDLFDEGDKIGIIYAIVHEGYDVNLAKENLQLSLDNRFGEDVIEIQTSEQLLEQFQTILDIVQYTLGGIALVSLVVGAFGIINTMFVIVTEKTKDIGIMKAIGARNGDIFFMYVFQAGTFGTFGAVFGLIFGSFAAFGFEAWAASAGFEFLQITVEPLLVVGLLLFGFGIGALSGLFPAWRASKLQIVETFRK